MKSREVKTIADARQIVEERDLSYVKVGLFDNDGVMRGKSQPLSGRIFTT